MKSFISALMLVCFANFSNAQTPEDYSKLWKDVQKLENEGLPKSALKIVETIEEKAKASNNTPQKIKTLLYRSKYALILEEDAQFNVIHDFRTAISESEIPTKNVLQNMLATLYWQYFNQNRYQFYNRTKTSEKTDTEDFRTWDLQTLFDEVHRLYQASLANGLILQQTDLHDYKAILIKQEDSEIFRPTLYDLLSHHALEFYKTDESSITKPAYKFEIDDEQLLSTASTFINLNVASKDSTSLQLNALKIYQNLIKFHSSDTSAEALVTVDIERLNFIYQNAVFTQKDDVYHTTLNTAYQKWNAVKNNVASRYAFNLAQLYYQQGQQYRPKTKENHRWKFKEALEICNTIIKDYPESEGAKQCRNLKSQILAESLQITTEDIFPINTNTLALINYKNIAAIDVKIGQLNDVQLERLRGNNNSTEQLEILNKMVAIAQWTSTLKDEQDYQQHSTEISIPKLDNGRYVIFGKVNNEKNTYAFKEIQVTNLAYIQKDLKGDVSYQIINRLNGQPIANAEVTMTYIKNYQGGSLKQKYVTDGNGEFSIQRENHNRSRITLDIASNNDKARFENLYISRYYNYGNDEPNYPINKAFLFTDRSIYRPGQPLYFKGIVMTTKQDGTQVLAKTPVEVTLYNTNGEDLSTLSLKTNEFGSVSGEFMLPNNGLTGNFSIQLKGKDNSNAYHYFSVEEYKRPKFEANFNPISETYKVNDTITVKGQAVAYAGSNISDAKVVYRVRRNVRYPDWYYWYRPYFNNEPQEIIHGETLTDTHGNFELKFKALPDHSVDESTLPIFNYEITADITDLNGETRSTSTIVNVGYHAMTASIAIANNLDKTDSKHELKIDTRNLNGEPVDASGSIKIYKLKAPNTVLRPRPWNAPDYQSFTKEEFKALFPHEAFNNEHDSRFWEKGELVFSETFDTKTSKSVALGRIKKWVSGAYRIVLESEDRFGQTVKDEAQIQLFSNDDKTLADHALFSVTTNKLDYTIGDTAELTFASAAEHLTVTIAIEKDANIIRKEIITLNANKKTISVPVTKDDLGGFAVHYSYAFKNSFSQGTKRISVPYPKTDLEIETLTFRDKLQPGTDETWQFKVKGPKGDKVTAEVLASMYDLSLDQFKTHHWSFDPIQQPNYYSRLNLSPGQSFRINRFRIANIRTHYSAYQTQSYDRLNFFGLSFGNRYRYLRRDKLASVAMAVESEVMEETSTLVDAFSISDDADLAGGTMNADGKGEEWTPQNSENQDVNGQDFSDVKIRKNLQETAFFFPQLHTDEHGNVSFSFTTPEALTKWKLQLLAHTKSLESATTSLETVTQKELMVIPNAPRFLRQGDVITISTKIANLTEQALSGQAKLALIDAISGEDITESLVSSSAVETFSVDKKGNTRVAWLLNIPDNVSAVQYKIIAKAGNFSDGEQNALPVLSNRMLVTETLPMWIRSNESKTFTLDKLKTASSNTLKHHKLTLEMTSNPAWYAVQALPYLMEYPYDCNEQTFSRYYANALASHIANSNPRIQEVFNQWRHWDALLSNLEKNQELKSLLIQETPWLRDAQSETEQKKRIALLFDLNKMNNELSAALHKLKNGQMDNGAWPWFNGGRPNRYITQHIITGFGHLDKLKVIQGESEKAMIEKAVHYLDSEFVKSYNDIKKHNPKADLSKDHLSYIQLHYLYMRSFFPQIKPSETVKDIMNYYMTQINNYWLSRHLYAKGLMALVSHRMNNKVTASKILKSLMENSITSEELGMYWKSNTNSWHWYQAPIETQALLIEAFSEAGDVIQSETRHLETIDNLKIWLLKNKQTNRWSTTKATTEAVYALLLQGREWLSVTEMVDVVLGGKSITPSKLDDVKVEAGTGYYKTSWSAKEIQPEMASVKLTKKGDGIAWGSLYWQYFEDLDKITSAETPLQLKKKLFKKTNTDTGEEITEITSETSLNVGDLVRVRIELRSDRTMEFVHMKDMRAAGLEPVNVLSQYKYQDGLGYYESTKDASTNFFFDYLPKGIYVFEYDLRVNNIGDMSNGITTIQSMYAPEFSSHSEGIRIMVN